jgi:hypothetical protein
MRGNIRGIASRLTPQFTSATANWLAHTAARTPMSTTMPSETPPAWAMVTSPAVTAMVNTMTAPR